MSNKILNYIYFGLIIVGLANMFQGKLEVAQTLFLVTILLRMEIKE